MFIIWDRHTSFIVTYSRGDANTSLIVTFYDNEQKNEQTKLHIEVGVPPTNYLISLFHY